MRVREKNQNCGATGHILLWLLGIPIPILLAIFYCEGALNTYAFAEQPRHCREAVVRDLKEMAYETPFVA